MNMTWLSGQPGAILLEAAAGSRRVVTARLHQNDGARYEFLLDGPINPGQEHPVMVSLGNGPGEQFAPVLRSTQDDTLLTVWTPGRWVSTCDRRGQRRYPLVLACTMYAGGMSAPGRCVDISLSGAAIETVSWQAPEFLLVLREAERAVCLPCRRVSGEQLGPVTVVHAAFGDIPEFSRPAFSELLAAVRAEFLVAQAFLAGRADDSLPPGSRGPFHRRPPPLVA